MTSIRTRIRPAGAAKRSILPCLLLALAACTAALNSTPYQADASMGMIIARDNCASCHELFLDRESPNPNAPPFRAIVNRPGMTPELLSTWLKDGHNYPAEMGFHLEPHKVDSLVAYMIRQQSGEPASEP
jgi:mono/diheme cytochrome c family protein